MDAVSCHSPCQDRQVNEMVRIGSTKDEVLINSKSDFQQAPLVRLVATTGLMEEQTSSQETGGRRWQEPGQEWRVGMAGRQRGGTGGGSEAGKVNYRFLSFLLWDFYIYVNLTICSQL